ncbi:hypothetical protein CR513_05525, partial [Mucuna pruriens]
MEQRRIGCIFSLFFSTPGRYEAHVLGEVLSDIQNRDYQEGNISKIDAANGGALMNKTPAAARHLISNMASNTQQFRIRGPSQFRMVNKIGTTSNLRLENQLSKLTSLARQLSIGQHQPNMAAKVYGICTSMEHPTDLCPTLQETELDQPENVGAIGGYQFGKQPYQNRPLDKQQYGRQPFRPRPNQGPYAA